MRIQTDSDKRMTNFMWIVGIVVTVFCGAGLTVALSYGGTKSDVSTLKDDVLRLKRTSVDYVYIQDLIQSNYLLVDILKSTPGSKEMEEAMKEWKDFQLSTVRRANPTRGGSGTGGASTQ